MWWRCPNEDSNPLVITIEVETSSSLKYELKVALQQVLSVELNIEHTTHLQLAHIYVPHVTFLFKMSWGKKPARNLTAAIQQIHGKFLGLA